MPDLTFDFVWDRDVKGYQLIPGKDPIRRRGQSVEEWLLNARLDDIQPPRIVRKGGKLQRYRPLKISDLFKIFVDMAQTEKGVLKFINTYGPLTRDKEGDDVVEVIDQAKEMLEVLQGKWGIGVMPLSKLSVWIETKRNGKIELKVRPACLLDAMWLQLAQSRSVMNIRECPQCHKAFMVGGGGGAQRRDAKFCSDECRIKFNSLARSRHHA